MHCDTLLDSLTLKAESWYGFTNPLFLQGKPTVLNYDVIQAGKILFPCRLYLYQRSYKKFYPILL